MVRVFKVLVLVVALVREQNAQVVLVPLSTPGPHKPISTCTFPNAAVSCSINSNKSIRSVQTLSASRQR